jgi:hypothetical protein
MKKNIILNMGENTIRLQKPIVCWCGKIHFETPYNAVLTRDGLVWFNCVCGSTKAITNRTRKNEHERS